MTALLNLLLSAEIAGRAAAERGLPHTANPHTWPDEWQAQLAWSHAWIVAKVEKEEGCKIECSAPSLRDLCTHLSEPIQQ